MNKKRKRLLTLKRLMMLILAFCVVMSCSFAGWQVMATDADPNSDTVAPVTTAQIQGTAGQNAWYTSDVNVELTASDDKDSVVSSVYYSFDDGANYALYSTPVAFSQSGTIQYYSVDSAGNTETAKTTQVNIDKEVPTFMLTAGGTAVTGDLTVLDISTTNVKLNAADTGSGICIQSIRLDGQDLGAESAISWAGKAGDHILSVLVQDNAGNKSEASYTIHVNTYVPDCDESHPHMIYTKQDLDAIRNHVVDGKVTGYFRLANDIVFDDADFQEGGEFYNNGLGWIPIGHNNQLLDYTGLITNISFDGAGYSITNLKMFGPNTRLSNGFIAVSQNSVIKNVRFYKPHIEAWSGTGVVYADSIGNTVAENVTIDEAMLINRGGAARPTGLFASRMKGTANNITIKNSTLTHINPTTGAKGNGWRQSLFAGVLLDDSKVSNINITGCTGVFYAYPALFATNVGNGTEINNVSMTNTKVTWTHYRYFYFLGDSYDGTPNAGRNVSINHVNVDVESIDANTNNASVRQLIPNDAGWKMNDAVFNFKLSTNKDISTAVNAENPDNLDNVFLTRRFAATDGTVVENKLICAAGIRTIPTFIQAVEIEAGQTAGIMTLSNGAQPGRISGLRFKSSNPAVASVSADGTVKGVTGGTAVVSAYATVNGQDYIIGSTAVTVNGEDVIVSINPVEIITEAGMAPALPSQVAALYASNTSKLVSVMWDSINPLDYARSGGFTVNGTVEGTEIKAVANVTVTNTAAATLSGANNATNGGQVELTFGLADVNGISAQDISISYDNTKFDFVRAESVQSGTVISETTATTGGAIRLIIVSTGAENAISGTKDVIKLIFEAKASGTGIISVTNAVLSNGAGDIIFADTASKTITVDADKAALLSAIAYAKDILNNAAEGIEIGMYPEGTKARLNAAIVKAEGISGSILTAEEVAQAIEDLNAAVNLFKNYVITSSTGDINSIPGYDIGDLGIVSFNYGKMASEPLWDSIKKADINGDGEIGLYDLAFVAKKIIGN